MRLLLALCLLFAIVATLLAWRGFRRLTSLRDIQPFLANRRARGLNLDARILAAQNCRAAISLEDPVELLVFLFTRARHSIFLFLERAPWWALLLPRRRVWILWNHENEAKDNDAHLGQASTILCKSEAAWRAAEELIASRALKSRARLVGFSSWEEPLDFPTPAAAGQDCRVLHLGGQSAHSQTRQVLETWLARPDFPSLTVICHWGCRDSLPSELIEAARRADNILWHGSPLPESLLERYMSEIPIHLYAGASQGFSHSINRSRGFGALIVATAAPRMEALANIEIESQTKRLEARVTASSIERAVELALQLPREQRVQLGRENQRRAREEHHHFVQRFREFAGALLEKNQEAFSPAKESEVHFFMGRLAAKTGGERYNQTCIEALRQKGYKVTYHWVSLYRSLSVVGLLPGLGKFLCSPFLCLLFCWRRGLFVVDEHFLDPMILTNAVRKMLGVGPLVVLVHHLDAYSSGRSSSPPGGREMAYQRARLAAADRVVTVSRYSRDEIVSLGYAAHGIVIVPPGFEEGSTAPLGSPPAEGPLCCLVIGRCEPRKDWETLLRAAALLPPEKLQVKLVGEASGRHFHRVVEPIYRQLKLQDRVRFLGRTSPHELEKLFSQHHVLVHPSVQEGFGIVILEALARGLPVVASASASIPELVEHGRDGLLFPQGDAEALARVLTELAEQRGLLEALRGKGREKARAYSWSRTATEFLEAVSPLLTNHP